MSAIQLTFQLHKDDPTDEAVNDFMQELKGFADVEMGHDGIFTIMNFKGKVAMSIMDGPGYFKVALIKKVKYESKKAIKTMQFKVKPLILA